MALGFFPSQCLLQRTKQGGWECRCPKQDKYCPLHFFGGCAAVVCVCVTHPSPSLFCVLCSLNVVLCSLSLVPCSLYFVSCSLYLLFLVPSSLYSVFLVLCTVFCVLCSVFYVSVFLFFCV